MREDVGVLDMSLMAKFLVQGPDAERVLERLSVSVVGREIGRLVYAMAQHRGRDRRRPDRDPAGRGEVPSW